MGQDQKSRYYTKETVGPLVIGAEKRITQKKIEYDSHLAVERNRLTTDMSVERSKVDGFARENDQLRKILSGGSKDHRSTSPTRVPTLNMSPPRSPKSRLASRQMSNIH